jgi:heptosyltransferase-1
VRLLIVKTSSMGDVVHALPLAADIMRAHPDAAIDWVVEEGFAAIPAMSPHVARVHRVALRRWRQAPWSPHARSEGRELKQTLRAASYDLVLDAQGLLKSAWIARWAQAPVAGYSSATVRERLASLFYQHGYDIPRSLHAVERCRALGAAALGYVVEGPPRFDLRCQTTADASMPDRYAVLLTNASRETKLWPADRWLELERWLAGRGLTSVLFWGTTEEGERTRALAAQMQRAVVTPRRPLADVAAVLSRATVVVGLDTGLSHLAAALGRPTVAIYCDYDPGLVGLVGDAPVASLGGVGRQTSAQHAIDAIERVVMVAT